MEGYKEQYRVTLSVLKVSNRGKKAYSTFIMGFKKGVMHLGCNAFIL